MAADITVPPLTAVRTRKSATTIAELDAKLDEHDDRDIALFNAQTAAIAKLTKSQTRSLAVIMAAIELAHEILTRL